MGTAGDVPIPGDYDSSGVTDFVVFAGSEADLYVCRIMLIHFSTRSNSASLAIFRFNMPPLTPSIGPAVRKAAAHRNARPKPVSTRTTKRRDPHRTYFARHDPQVTYVITPADA